MKKFLEVNIISIEGVAYSGNEVSEVYLTTENGRIGVLANHKPLISKITPCKVNIKSSEGEFEFDVSDGVIEVKQGSKVVILVEKCLSCPLL